MSRQNSFPETNILGVGIDILTINDAAVFITDEARKGPARYISKPYVEFFDKEPGKDGIVTVLNNAFMCLPEGVAVQWAAYFRTTSGSPWQLFKSLAEIVVAPKRIRCVVPEKFGGTNFTWPLLATAAEKNLSVYLVGTPLKNSIEHTAKHLQGNIKGLNIVGTSPGRDEESGVFSEQMETGLLKELRQKRPDLVLIGIGFPKQEYLARKLASQLDHGILIGEGGTFDYRLFGGRIKKAPQILQLSGLEWLWRLALQPKRIKRQMAVPKFIIKVYKNHPSR